VAGFCVNCNGPSGSIKRKNFLDKLSIRFLRIHRTMQSITVNAAPVSSTTMLRYVEIFRAPTALTAGESLLSRRSVGPQFRSTCDDEDKNL
jgi:hypothetical protein